MKAHIRHTHRRHLLRHLVLPSRFESFTAGVTDIAEGCRTKASLRIPLLHIYCSPIKDLRISDLACLTPIGSGTNYIYVCISSFSTNFSHFLDRRRGPSPNIITDNFLLGIN